MKKLILAFLLCATLCQAQWNTEQGTIIKYDKVEHFIGCAGLYSGLRMIGQSPEMAVHFTITAQFLWEVKDELMPWEKYGWWGGEGFCWRDLVAGSAGAIVAYWIDTKIVQPVFGEKATFSFTRVNDGFAYRNTRVNLAVNF